jgi:hypothetical protein
VPKAVDKIIINVFTVSCNGILLCYNEVDVNKLQNEEEERCTKQGI